MRNASKLALPTRWPTAEVARNSMWFSPIEVGNLVLRERTWVPAMVPWRCTSEGFVTDRILEWYRRFAEGQPGAIVVEATGIREIKSGPLMRIGHDRYLEGLKRLTEVVREASGGRTRLFIQLIDFLNVRRRPGREVYFRRYLPITPELRERAGGPADEDALRQMLHDMDDQALAPILGPREMQSLQFGYRESVNDMDNDEICALPERLPELFALAAARAQRAGFDGVELHFAHAYTMASFLSRANQRTDGYGSTRQGRVRLPLEVYAAVRAAVGARYVVGCRFLGHEVIRGGSDLPDAVYFGRQFAAAGMDYLSISKGGKFEDARQPKVGEAVYPYTGPSGHECMPTVYIDKTGPFGRNVNLAATIREAVRGDGLETPLVTAGGICTFHQAEAILTAGQADIVAAARQTLADPDWFAKAREGRGDSIRRCLFTNYCESLDQRHKEVTCQLWDRAFAGDFTGLKSADGRRRLVAPPRDPE